MTGAALGEPRCPISIPLHRLQQRAESVAQRRVLLAFRTMREQVNVARTAALIRNGGDVLSALPFEVLTARLQGDLGRVFFGVYQQAGDAAAGALKAALRGAVKKYSPDQPRVPAGSPEGGEWTSGAGGIGGGASVGGPGGETEGGGASAPQARLRRKLSDQQHVILQDYQQGGYGPINEALREGGDGGQWAADVRTLDGAIARGVTTAPQTVYRGTTHEGLHRLVAAGKADGLVGRELTMPTFVSTTSDRAVAASFGAHEQHQVIYRISVPKGVRALPVGIATASHINDEESELLLPRNSRFRVTGVGSARTHGRSVPVMSLELL